MNGGLAGTLTIGTERNNQSHAHNNNEEDAEQATQVWNSLLRPKTIRKGGGHEYFAIVTEKDEVQQQQQQGKNGPPSS